MAAKNKNQQKVNKELAEMILRVQGRDYADWLDEQHQEVVSKGTNVIRQVTAAMTTGNMNNTNSTNNNVQRSEGGE